MTRCAPAMGAGATALHLLMKLLANPLSQQAGKWLVIPQTAGYTSNVSEVQSRHGAAEPVGAGATALHLLPQTAGYASNVSEVQS